MEGMVMDERDDRELNANLWAGQVLLAGAFHVLGLLKLLVPAPDLQQGLHLLTQAPVAILRPVGVVELIGSVGIILPAATGVLPRLTTIAAGCLSGVALLGAVMPATAGGFGLVLPNFMLAAVAAFVAWGRAARVPIAPLGLRESARTDRALAVAFFDLADAHFSERAARKDRGQKGQSAA
jgi:hypothetical protein